MHETHDGGRNEHGAKSNQSRAVPAGKMSFWWRVIL